MQHPNQLCTLLKPLVGIGNIEQEVQVFWGVEEADEPVQIRQLMPAFSLESDMEFDMENVGDNPHNEYGCLSQPATGGLTCHSCHGCVTDFRPILGNPVEVTHVTSLGHVYIFPR